MWAVINVVVAQTAAPDDLLSWGLTLSGVTIPFAVGWAWNRQWAESVKRQNEFLVKQDEVLRQELTDERAEKLLAHEEADKLRRQMGAVEIELMKANAERDAFQRRLEHLETVVRLRKIEVPEPPSQGIERRQRDLIREPEGGES